MIRRDFVQTALKLLASGLLLPSFSSWHRALGLPPVDPRVRLGGSGARVALDGRVLVLVNLSGGNDGLNTVVPYTDPLYYAARPGLGIPPEQVVAIGAETGLHPNLAALQAFYDAGRMAVIQGVTYPDPNLSHFRSTDIWFSGSSSDELINTGWLARFLEVMFPEFPDVLPLAPFGLQQGIGLDLPLHGERGQTGVVVDNPDTFYQLVDQTYVGEFDDEPPDTRGGEELSFVRSVDVETFQYADAIRAASEAGENTVAYPGTNLGVQMEIVARLLSGGLDTPVYLTAEFGFDTHIGQSAVHGNLMASVGQSLASFMTDLDNQGLSERVLVMTVSEFGRRVDENGGAGTDHGTAAPMFALGAGVRGGIYGGSPDLADLDPNGNLRLQHDFRSVYTDVIRRHFGADEAVAADVLNGAFDPVEFLDDTVSVGESPATTSTRVLGVHPNPASIRRSERVLLRYELARAGEVTLDVFDVRGRRLAHLPGGRRPAGAGSFTWKLQGAAPGVYLARLTVDGQARTVSVRVLP